MTPSIEPIPAEPGLHPLFEAAEQRWLEHWRRGPTRRVWTALPPQDGDPAPDLMLPDGTGAPIQLSDLWADRPALLLFWRHWGCGCGVGRAELLREQYGALAEAGAEIVVIGQGEPERAAWYATSFGLPCRVVCDVDGSAYEAYGLLEMSPSLLLGEPKPDMASFEAMIPEHRAKGRPVADNPFLLPGEFVVDRHGRLVLSYRYQYCDNYPDLETLTGAIAEAMANG
jgi:peroxiredoxin